MQRRRISFAVAMSAVLLPLSSAAMAQYKLTNLVSSVSGQASHTDPLLVNAARAFIADPEWPARPIGQPPCPSRIRIRRSLP